MARASVVCALMALVLAGGAACQTADEVIALARKGTSEAILLAFVEASAPSAELTAADIVHLAEAKVSDKVIIAMLKRQQSARQEQGDIQIAATATDQAQVAGRQFAALFRLKDGRIVKALNFVVSGDEYIVKNEKGRLVTLKKSEVASVEELERKRDESQVVIQPRRPEPVVLRDIEPPQVVYRDTYIPVYRDSYVPVDYTPEYIPVYDSYYETRYRYYPRSTYIISRPGAPCHPNWPRPTGYYSGCTDRPQHRSGCSQSGHCQQSSSPRQTRHYSSDSRNGVTARIAF